MCPIKIERYQDYYFDDMISLIVDSFNSKFCYRQTLTEDDIKTILSILWDITSEDKGYLHYIAKEDQHVVGVILVRCGVIQKKHRKTPIFSLIYHYGFLNILRLFCKLSVLEVHDPEDCYIEHIAVNESMRGQGIGAKLIVQVEKELQSRGFSSLTLAVAKDNPAKHLYDRIGFKETDIINHRYNYYLTGIKQWKVMKKEFKK